MKSSSLGHALFCFALGFAPALSGCGDDNTEHEPKGQVGKVDMALTGTAASGKLYRLRNGVIEITGPTAGTLNTEDHLDVASVEVELKAGDYVAELNDGWTLERAFPGTTTFEPVEAVLVSPNPLPFTIEGELTTRVRLLFNAGEAVVLEHDGRAVIEIGVDDCVGAGAADCDLDGDGVPGSDDCDDSDLAVHPGTQDVCDGRDNNCNGLVDEANACGGVFGDPGSGDFDHDRFFGSDDCDDSNPNIFPGRVELCDALDNNCDGDVDENNACENCISGDPGCDGDGDGFVGANDCNDSNENVFPGAPELCDGVDTGCDGQRDENITCGCLFDCDFDGDGWRGGADCNDFDPNENPGAPELCDGKDNNCNGLVNESIDAPFNVCKNCIPGGDPADCDVDGDGYPEAYDCNNVDLSIFAGAPELCDGYDNDCDGLVDESSACEACVPGGTPDCDDFDGDGFRAVDDCNDRNSSVFPGAPDVCDLRDNNCDSQVDENNACASDHDGDGFPGASDCDDTDPLVHPNAGPEYLNVGPQFCDDRDNNCNGYVDEFNDCEHDNDGDGFPRRTDCDDRNAAAYPGAPEVCYDGRDDNCDGQVDENPCINCYYWEEGEPFPPDPQCDFDRDRFPMSEDCDDFDEKVSPGAAEECDGQDNNCNGKIDESFFCDPFYGQ